nr:mechanosensitive ion channel family protein [Deltaproteobacteria bacterium]
MLRRAAGVAALLALLAGAPLGAQPIPPAVRAQFAPTPPTPPAVVEEPEDRVEPDSPRASLQRFAELAQRGRWEEAARYLDLAGRPASDGPVMAYRLREVLDRYLGLDPTALSGESAGDTDDGLPARVDEFGRIPGATAAGDPVRLMRREFPDGARWVFNRATVRHVEGWYQGLEGRWIRGHLPPWWLQPWAKGLLRWQWASLALTFALSLSLGALLSRLTLAAFAPLLRRVVDIRDESMATHARAPLTWLWAVGLVSLSVGSLGLSRAADNFVQNLLRALLFAGLFWALWRTIALLARAFRESAWARLHPGSVTVVPLIAQAARVVLACISVVAVLSALGYPVASLLAGLGLGGLALALAAQKTVEHLLGSVAIGLDQPFRVGDLVKLDEHTGTIESVGLRSTRVRTFDRTLVTIPNGKLADVRVENYTQRDRIRLLVTLALELDTAPARVRAVLSALEEVLRAHPKLWTDELYVQLKAVTADSLQVEVMAWFETGELQEFWRYRQEVLLSFLDALERLSVKMARPSQTLHLAPGAGAGTETRPPG